MTVLFDGSFDGLLTIVYAYYYEKLRPVRIVDESLFQPQIGEEYQRVETDFEKAKKVSAAILEKISFEVYEAVYSAFLSSEPDRFLHILKYIVLAFSVNTAVERYEKYDYVATVRKYAKYTWKEAHLLKGFTRFSETRGGILYAEISPKNNVLPILAEHFADRLSGEKWIIRDTLRNIAAVYERGSWIQVPCERLSFEYADCEDTYKLLYALFHKTIAVEDRISNKRQRHMLPLRFRKNMFEFSEKYKHVGTDGEGEDDREGEKKD